MRALATDVLASALRLVEAREVAAGSVLRALTITLIPVRSKAPSAREPRGVTPAGEGFG